MNETLTLAEVRYSLEAAAEHLGRLRGRLPDDTPDEVALDIGQALGLLHKAMAAIKSGKASSCMWCRYGDHPSGPVCPVHQAGHEPTDADYWDAIYDRGQR